MSGPLVLLLQLALSTQALDSVVQAGIRRGVYPGAVVVIGRHDRILVARGYGHLTWSARSPAPQPDSTLYELASLTKVVATTSAVMLLLDAGQLELDRPVREYLPEFQGPGKERVTVRDLLAHTSGLPSYRPFYQTAPDAAALRRLVMAEPLRWPPGSRVEYSDLNAMLLGWIVEAVSGERLDAFVRRRVFLPAGMLETTYRPPPRTRARMAPVGLWHGRPVAGRVHDQNAERLGGVSGHAGLFSTGSDLARFAQIWLRGGRTASCQPLFRPETVALFTRRASGTRALGWELRDTTTPDNAGRLMSAAAFGHTGFTGTSLWIDPAHDLFVVILTNRVYAPRARHSIAALKEIRGKVADRAVELVGAQTPARSADWGLGPRC